MDAKSAKVASSFSADDPRWKYCAHCGSKFYNIKPSVKTCSRKCGIEICKQINAQKRDLLKVPDGVIDRRNENYKGTKYVIKDCVICGQKYAVAICLRDSYRTCSDECRAMKHSNDKRRCEQITKRCEWCNSEFSPKPGIVAERRRFCSDHCRLEWLNNKNRKTKTRRKSTCRTCGYIFNQKRVTQKWCSRECMWKDEDYIQRRTDAINSDGPTRLERWLFEALDEMSMVYEPYKPLGSYTADAFLPEYGIVVEVDGLYWHSKRPELDRLRDRILAKKGYTTIRFGDDVLINRDVAIPILISGISDLLSRYECKQFEFERNGLYRIFWSEEIYRSIKEVV